MKYALYFVDTNVFIYRTQKQSPYYEECKKFLDLALMGEISITTSVETLQEVVHVFRRTKQNSLGIRVAKLILEQNTDLLEINAGIIEKFVVLAEKYPRSDSRDLLRVAACSYNGIRPIITLDKDFKSYKEVVAMSPSEIK